jgi:D-sedoheptulose 7-phosphate isomerase
MERKIKRANDKFENFIKILKVPEISLGADGFTPKRTLEEGFEEIARLISKQCIDGRKKLIFIGNGGSASISSHQAVDFFNNLGIDARSFDSAPLLTCMANDFGYENVFAKPISVVAQEGDVLVAISSSGKSPNILKAVEAARKKGCRIITMSGFKSDNPLRKMGDINFYVPSNSYRYVEASHSLYWDFILELLIDEEYEKIKK